MKFIFSEDRFIHNIPIMIRKLLLQIMTVAVSEAICESWGSTMERYHTHFTHGDLDDTQMQIEMFVYLVGPPVGKCLPFVKKAVEAHGKSFFLEESARFHGRGKVVDKMKRAHYDFPFKFD